MADPFYEEILQALTGPLDDDCFELCVSSLLTKEFPTLVPIRGGTDSGMDGVTASDGPFLVCTTGKDVIRNLTGSLKSHLKNGGTRRSLVLATSQELSETRRRNLQKRARDLGFSLLQIYPRAAMAERLYHEPRWCKDLLGLTGRPSPLTLIPFTTRPLTNQALIGRDEEIKWLQDTHGDRIVTGQPGSGKTSLLHHLVLRGWGLFLVDDDLAAIANAIRKQQPKVIIVDDAHFRTELLTKLIQLRREINAQFDIVGSCWTGDKDLVAEVLTLSSSQVCELPLLTRDEMVQVTRHAGLGGPVELIREIVTQAEGRPGLAVTLSHLSLSGDVREVLYGNALRRSLLTAFEQLVGKTVAEVLAAFALGGDAGASMEAVSKVIGISMSELRASLVKLAAGGVLRQSYDRQLSVWPRSLRYVLVRDVFFSGACDLPYKEIASELNNNYALVDTLLGAISRGAQIPEIRSLLESVKSPTLWQNYASLGEEEANFVLINYPEKISDIGAEALELTSQRTLPLLFNAAIGDERPIGNAANHPLRKVQDWIRHTRPDNKGEAIQRRSILVNAIKDWLAKGGDQRVGIRALSIAFSPGFETVTADPGSGNTISFMRAPLSNDELSQLLDLWGDAKSLLETLDSADWQELLNTVHEWIYPETLTFGDVPQPIKEAMRRNAQRIVRDILAASKCRPGVQQWGRKVSKQLGLEIQLSVEREFEILFPKFEIKNWEKEAGKQQSAVMALAEEWSVKTPAEVAATLLRLEKEATVQHTWPRWTPTLCELLAQTITDANEWFDCFIETQLPGDLCFAFLQKAVKDRVNGWEKSVVKCLENPVYEWVAVSILIRENDLPSDLLDTALQRVTKYPDMVHLACLRNQVTEGTLKAMLSHADIGVSTQAAIGTWWADPRGEISHSIANEWRAAILRAHGQQFFSTEILEGDKDLAFEWLIARIDERPKFFDYHTRKEISAAISVLDSQQRIATLPHVPSDGLLTFELLRELASDDLKVCEELLQTPRFRKYQLTFLRGHPKELWIEKAQLALNAGYSAQDIVGATIEHDSSWTGEESNMWQGWIDDFAPLLAHEDTRIRSIAEIATAKLNSLQADARKTERRAAVYGR